MRTRRHAADGTDDEGKGLLVTIRVGADGSLYFHDLTVDLLPVARTLAPHDPALRERCEAAERFGQERSHEHSPGVEERGSAAQPCRRTRAHQG